MTSIPVKGRGALSKTRGRFARRSVEADEEPTSPGDAPATEIRAMRAGRIISQNSSPDVPFNRSINPFQGCEHGCVYCYARPSHSYLDLSPGIDFETRIFYKPNAAQQLLAAWEKPAYVVEPITLGANTDPYQPAEKTTRVTRELLEMFDRHQHPVSIITKGTLIERDIELLARLASRNLCSVAISLPTLDDSLKRIMEPRVSSARTRLRTIRSLVAAGVPTHVLAAPVIPAINDHEIEAIIDAAADAGVLGASYIFLRLPHEVRAIFREWLSAHFPDRASRVMSLVRSASGGQDYDPEFGRRQRGRGAYADMLASRFAAACRKRGLRRGEYQNSLDTRRFKRPGAQQLGLDF